MHADTYHFLSLLLAHLPQQHGYLTFTAIHPDRPSAPPSRHFPLPCPTPEPLEPLLLALQHANEQGWGAFVGIGSRFRDLGRWHRGTRSDIAAIPALYVDIDQPLDVVRSRLAQFPLTPSLHISSGFGSHLYFLLAQPATNTHAVDQALTALAQIFGGDPLTAAQSLRLPGYRNPKHGRNNALCTILDSQPDAVYPFELFPLPEASAPPPALARPPGYAHTRLNPDVIAAVLAILYRDFQAAPKAPNSRWHKALCPLGHKRDYSGSHFFFDELAGAANCFGRHGALPLKTLCAVLNINPDSLGGLYV